MVLPKEKDLGKNKWAMGRVVSAKTDKHKLVRTVYLKMANGSMLNRPIDKLVLLVELETD